jgi:hypothetical protein
MSEQDLDTHHKALKINLDPRWYGTFAEIGAGQEVVRWFFRVGAAAGTVAKSISAYDMIVSDAIYGSGDRYVSRDRLQAMLDREFMLNVDRLSEKRGDTTAFSLLPTPWWRAASRVATNATAGWASSSNPAHVMNPARSSSTSGCWIPRPRSNKKLSA